MIFISSSIALSHNSLFAASVDVNVTAYFCDCDGAIFKVDVEATVRSS